jgi:multiple sugar transport system permease protein/raffinose/stachyose/melibiose transport system permease protein
MTGGDPLYSTTTIVHQIYQRGFAEFKMGYAAAMSVVLLVIVLVVTIVNYRFGSSAE